MSLTLPTRSRRRHLVKVPFAALRQWAAARRPTERRPRRDFLADTDFMVYRTRR